ncbi:MAG: hypothetical protein PT939_06575 [Aerococcus suis]|nr:hypothetical protein [Aerococcus suis]
MKVLYSPQICDDKEISYQFNDKLIKVTINDLAEGTSKTIVYDLSTITANKQYEMTDYILSIDTSNDLQVTLLNYVPIDADDSKLFPEPFTPNNEDFEATETVQLKEIPPDNQEEPISEIEQLQEELDKQKERVAILEQCVLELGEGMYD